MKILFSLILRHSSVQNRRPVRLLRWPSHQFSFIAKLFFQIYDKPAVYSGRLHLNYSERITRSLFNRSDK